MNLLIETEIKEAIATKEKILAQHGATIEKMGECLAAALKARRKVLICGNGGSAADAQHIAAELVGRFMKDRAAWPAIALTTDTSILTAVGNDYGFEHVFSRQVEALGASDDVLIAITTSGSSPNVLAAVGAAKKKGLRTIAFTGKEGGKIASMVDIAFIVPSFNTQRIQESHIMVAHILCSLVERALSPA